MEKKMNAGKQFEKDFKDSVPSYVDVTRLKDGGGWSNASNMRFTSSNPCDFILYSSLTRNMYKLELKSVAGKSLPYANFHGNDLSIKRNHLWKLLDSEQKGVNCWYVVNFRSIEETYWAAVSEILEYVETSDRKSIPVDWFRNLLGRKILQVKKRVHFRYDLEWL